MLSGKNNKKMRTDGKQFRKYKKLISISRPDQIAVLKSILTANNISFQVESEHFASMHILAQSCSFVVDEKQFSTAKQLLKNLDV